jgi:hypothetical protein
MFHCNGLISGMPDGKKVRKNDNFYKINYDANLEVV